MLLWGVECVSGGWGVWVGKSSPRAFAGQPATQQHTNYVVGRGLWASCWVMFTFLVLGCICVWVPLASIPQRAREELLECWDRDRRHQELLSRKTRDMVQRSQEFRRTYSASLSQTAKGAVFGCRPSTSGGGGAGGPPTPYGASGRPETSHSSRSLARLS